MTRLLMFLSLARVLTESLSLSLSLLSSSPDRGFRAAANIIAFVGLSGWLFWARHTTAGFAISVRGWLVLVAIAAGCRARAVIEVRAREGDFGMEDAAEVVGMAGSWLMALLALFAPRPADGYVKTSSTTTTSSSHHGRRRGRVGINDADEPLLREERGAEGGSGGGSERTVTAEGEVLVSEDRLSPEIMASLFSLMFFRWAGAILSLGRSRALEQVDLPELRPGDTGSVNLRRFLRARRAGGGVLGSLWRAFRPTFLASALFKLASDSLSFAGPLLLNSLIHFAAAPEGSHAPYYGYALVALLAAAGMATTITLHQNFSSVLRLGIRVKSALSAAIAHKALRLEVSGQDNLKTSSIVNMLSVDVTRIYGFASWIHLGWAAPLQIVIATTLLYRLIRWAVFVGIAVMLILGPLAGIAVKISMRLNRAIMQIKDERIKAVGEILSGILVIKLFAAEPFFIEKIAAIRKREMYKVLRNAVIGAGVTIIWVSAPILVASLSFMAFVLAGNKLDAATAFTSLSLFNLLQVPLTALPMFWSSAAETMVSVRRIETFLNAKEAEFYIDQDAVDDEGGSEHDRDEPPIVFQDASFSYDSDRVVLEGVSLSVKRGSLTAITGPVGCGKSSVFMALLGGMRRVSGSVRIRGSVAYAAQQPWIQNDTVRNNILFGEPFHPARYQAVVECCALDADLAVLVKGDQTLIGERGISLSGGQKARIALARAAYSDAQVVLLDDPLSAVDAHVGKHIFEKCLTGFMKGRTRVLITHQLQVLPSTDTVIVLGEGKVVAEGSFQELKDRGVHVSFAASEPGTPSPGLAASSDDHHPSSPAGLGARDAEQPGDETQQGTATPQPPPQQQKQPSGQKPAEEGGEEEGEEGTREDRETGIVKLHVWAAWARASGGLRSALLLVLLFAASQGATIAQSLWLSHWSSAGTLAQERGLPTPHKEIWYLGVYSALGALSIAFVFFQSVGLAVVSITAARTIHEAALKAALFSGIGFFHTTPTGRILNRFSGDVEMLDDGLRGSLGSFLDELFQVVGIAVVLCLANNPLYMASALVPVMVLFYFVASYFRASSRELKRLESITKSPIMSAVSSNLDGRYTVLAFRRARVFLARTELLLDENAKALWTTQVCNRWLAVRLESLGLVVIACTALLVVVEHSRSASRAALAGLSLNYAISICGALNWLIRTATLVEVGMVGVERLLRFSELPSEAPAEIPGRRPDPSWPRAGALTIRDLRLRYRPGLPLVLKGLTVSIPAGCKVGVVGRTGAGKSSLLLALFRLVEPEPGSVMEIDGVDVLTMGLRDLRTKMAVIPQDPVLFQGTVRSNLDPFSERGDAELWAILEEVRMAETLRASELGLASPVADGGGNFSQGERQLLCLCRALLRPARILVLDEPSANLDFRSDELIQRSIRERAQHMTVITVAHRLETVLGSDMILVLDDGRVAEQGSPKELLANKQGLFYKLRHGRA